MQITYSILKVNIIYFLLLNLISEFKWLILEHPFPKRMFSVCRREVLSRHLRQLSRENFSYCSAWKFCLIISKLRRRLNKAIFAQVIFGPKNFHVPAPRATVELRWQKCRAIIDFPATYCGTLPTLISRADSRLRSTLLHPPPLIFV